ncbi:MAG: Nif11-like leader peptide family natural product precursor [Chlorobium sp.]|nr:MAG: Nif11-like leader peptide family natural product precursor [Chlorobium sp.]
MSQEHAKAFLERMKNDEEFNGAVLRMEDSETKMAFIQREGYEFTTDELETASSSISM